MLFAICWLIQFFKNICFSVNIVNILTIKLKKLNQIDLKTFLSKIIFDGLIDNFQNNNCNIIF